MNSEGPKKSDTWHPFHCYNLCVFQPYKIKKYFWILGWRNACIWVWIKIKYFWILGSRNACIWVWIRTLYKMKGNLETQPRWGQKISHPWIRREFYVKLLEHLGKIFFVLFWHLFLSVRFRPISWFLFSKGWLNIPEFHLTPWAVCLHRILILRAIIIRHFNSTTLLPKVKIFYYNFDYNAIPTYLILIL